MQEKFVYYVDLTLLENAVIATLSDEEYKKLVDKYGRTFTIQQFVDAYNLDEIASDNSFIRIL